MTPLDARLEVPSHRIRGQQLPTEHVVAVLGSSQGAAEESKQMPLTLGELFQSHANAHIPGVRFQGQGGASWTGWARTQVRERASLAFWNKEERESVQEMTSEGLLWSTNLCNGSKMVEAEGTK